MKLHAASLMNLQLATNWVTAKDIARKRNVPHAGVYHSFQRLHRDGLVDVRGVLRVVNTTPEFRRTEAGDRALADPANAPTETKVCRTCGVEKRLKSFDFDKMMNKRHSCNACTLKKRAANRAAEIEAAVTPARYPEGWPWKYNGRVYGEQRV